MDQQLALGERGRTTFWAATAAAERGGRQNGAMNERWVAPDDGEE